MNREVRSATIVLLVLSPMALSACSAGQVTQTATQVRDRTGGSGQVGDLTVRAAQLVYPPGGVYGLGDQAELTMAIVNSGRVDDQLVDITGADFSAVAVSAPPAASSTGAVTPPDTTSPEPVPVDSTAEIAQSPAPEGTAVDILIPAREAVFIGTGTPPIVLTGLTRPIDAAQSVELTLTFARSGQTTVPAMMGPAPDVLPRSPVIDF